MSGKLNDGGSRREGLGGINWKAGMMANLGGRVWEAYQSWKGE